MTIQIQVTPQQQELGSIEWNQPESQVYQPGQALAVEIHITNPTVADREYQLYLGLYNPDTQEVIPDTWNLIPVDGEPSFIVAAGAVAEMTGELTLDQTGVLLVVVLYDVATDLVVGVVTTLLEAPETQNPGTGLENLMPLISGVMVMGMMGAILPMTTRMFRRKEE